MIENTTLRMGGLASGMNTDEIVDSLVAVQKMKLDKLEQSKTLANWKSDAYRDVNKQADEFRKAMEGLRLNSTFGKQKVTSGDPRLEVASAGTSDRTDFVISEAKMATSAKPAMVSFANNGETVGESGFTFKIKTLKTIDMPDGGIDITLKSGQTLDQAIATINEKSSETGVKASNVGGSLVFTTIGEGGEEKIEIDIGNSIGNPFGLKNEIVAESNERAAKSGSVTINGTQIEITSNSFTYEGVTFNLKGDIAAGSQIGVGVSSDTEAVFDKIKTFVDKYNELIEDLNGQLREKKYRDYPPLTDAQRKELSDNEVELWDERAKSGLLANDTTIRSFLTDMRNSLSTAVGNGALKTLDEIGIEFSKNYRDNGKLILDEDKLRGMLQTNLDDVRVMFAGKATGESSKDTTVTDRNMHDDSGFGWRIYDRLNLVVKQLGSLAGSPNSNVDTQSSIAKEIKGIDERMDREQRRIQAYEDRLWRQFTAMEKAIAQMNSQSSWLYQQM